MATARLHDEFSTRQEQQIADLGADLYNLHDDGDIDADEPAYGADPFDIVAHREELGYELDDSPRRRPMP